MTSMALVKPIKTGLIVCGLMFIPPFVAAQESPPAQQEKPAGHMGMQRERMGHGHMRHEHMEEMHQEMQQELQQQLTALREHANTMEGISDEKQLLAEMKKHQQMTDRFLGTLLEQREKMHAQMKEHHKQMQSRMGQKSQTEKQEPEGHETHPEGE